MVIICGYDIDDIHIAGVCVLCSTDMNGVISSNIICVNAKCCGVHCSIVCELYIEWMSEYNKYCIYKRKV